MDKIYWQEYYNKHEAPEAPSKFARYILESYTQPGQRLIELGCGNGRDATYFGVHDLDVLAIDQAETSISELSSKNSLENVQYKAGDFTSMDTEVNKYDIVYSRFTLHSISHLEQARTLAWAASALIHGGHLCVEVRGQKNSLFQKGEPVSGEPDAYVHDNHYRRFLSKQSLDTEVDSLGLTIVESSEAQGYAPFGDEDDFFIRQVSTKN